MRVVCFVILMGLATVLTGCEHKPAYSNVNTERPRSAENANGSGTGELAAGSSTPPAAGTADSQTPPSQPPQDAKKIRIPDFLDRSKGEARDLPNYPRSRPLSIQYGPISGNDTLSLALQTKDSMDDIAAFYEKVVKSNGWTVTDKTRDPDLSEWNLKKGDRNSAKVRVQKDPKSGLLDIIVVRTEKIEESEK